MATVGVGLLLQTKRRMLRNSVSKQHTVLSVMERTEVQSGTGIAHESNSNRIPPREMRCCVLSSLCCLGNRWPL
jgi:hypothetical protein